MRPAEASEAEALAELAAATFPLACPPGTTAEAVAEFLALNLSADSFRRYLADPERALLVAVEEDRLVGYSMLVRAEPTDAEVRAAVPVRPSAELSKIYVLPDAHGGGIARDLMAATLDRAAAAGIRAVWLGVNRQNARAIRFYGKTGFDIAGEKSFRVGPDLHRDHVMVRHLP